MALRNDNISINVSIETRKAQLQIHELEKASRGLKDENKSIRQEMNRLVAAGKKNTAEYSNLERQYKANASAIRKNTAEMDRLEGKIEASAKSYNQLRNQAKKLQTQLNNTVKALDPEEYERLSTSLKSTREAMVRLNNEAKESFLSFGKVKTILKGAFAQVGYNITNAIGSAIGRMKEFAAESISLATQADGVTHAFRAMDDGTLLNSLRKATKGTVDDLQLMQAAVKARDFRIPLEDMGKYLAFAQLKAQQTGQSVDYMTESIVTGLGRQSLMILDNLGLSAAEIREEAAKTGDFMKGVAAIVDRQLKQSGVYVSASDKSAQAAVNLRNAQLKLGEALSWVGDIQLAVTNGLARMAGAFASAFNEKTKAAVESLAIAIGAVSLSVGLYKAALLASSAVHRVNIALIRQAVLEKRKAAAESIVLSKAEAMTAARATLAGKATRGLVASVKSLTLALLKCPWVWAAAAVAAVGAAIYSVITAETEQEKAIRRSNEYITKQAEMYDNLKQKASSIASTMTDANNSIEDRFIAYRQLQRLMPEVLQNLDWENAKLLTNAELQERIAKEARRKKEIDLRIKVIQTKREIDKANKRVEEAQLSNRRDKSYIIQDGVNTVRNLSTELESYQNELKTLTQAKATAIKAAAKDEIKNLAYWTKKKQEAETAFHRLASDQTNGKLAAQLKREIEEAEKEIARYSLNKKESNTSKGKTEKETAPAKPAPAKPATANDPERERLERYRQEVQAMRDFLKEYGSYYERRKAIDDDYNDRIARARTKGERLTLEREKKETIATMDARKMSEEIDWTQTFEGVGNVLGDLAKETLAKVEAYMKTNEYKGLSAENKKTYTDLRNNLTAQQGDATSPFNLKAWSNIGELAKDYRQSVIDLQEANEKHKKAVEELTLAENELKNATGLNATMDARRKVEEAQLNVQTTGRELNSAQDNKNQKQDKLSTETNKAANGLSRFNQVLGNITSGTLSGFVKGVTGIIQALTKDSGAVGSAFGEIGGKAGGLIGAILTLIDVLGTEPAKFIDDLLAKISDVLYAVLSQLPEIIGSVVKGVGNIVGSALNGIGSMFGVDDLLGLRGNGKEIEEYVNALTQSNSALEKSINNLSDKMDKENGMKAVGYYLKMEEAQRQINENMRSILDAEQHYWKGHHSNMSKWNLDGGSSVKEKNDYIEQINELLGTNLTDTWDDFSRLTAEQMNEIRTYLPTIWNAMLEQGEYDNSQYFNQYADQAGKLEELTEQINTKMMGVSFDSMRDSFVSSLMDMSKDASDFATDFQELMSKALLNISIGDLLDTTMKEFYNRYAEHLRNGTMTTDMYRQAQAEYMALTQQGMEIRDGIFKITGYEGESSSSQSGTSKGFEGMSQESADELNGRFTALYASSVQIGQDTAAISQTMLLSLSCCVEIRDILQDCNAHLEKIELYAKNTSLSAEKLKQIETNTSRI